MTQPNPSTDIRRDLVALLPRMRRFAQTLSADSREIDSLLREVARQAIQKSHHWRGEGRLESWLFSMMRTIWTDEFRKNRRADRASSHSRLQATANARAAKLNGHDPAEALLLLPEGLASAILLADVEDFSYSEAATILGIAPEIFAARLCTARLSLAAVGSEASERRA